MVRESTAYSPSNAYIVSIQLNATTKAKLDKLCAQSGFSRSHMIRILITGATVVPQAQLDKEKTATPSPIPGKPKKK